MPLTSTPKHFRNLKGHELRVEMLRFKLRFAALMTMPRGSLSELAETLGVHPNSLSNIINTGHLAGEHCVKLEQVCGKVDFPRQWFNPELYAHVGA